MRATEILVPPSSVVVRSRSPSKIRARSTSRPSTARSPTPPSSCSARSAAATWAASASRELVAAAAGDPRIDEAFAASLKRVRAEILQAVEDARASGELPWRNERLTEADVGPLVDLVLAGFRAARA